MFYERDMREIQNFLDDAMTCTYEKARGTFQISANIPFQVLPDSDAISFTETAGPTFLWVGSNRELNSIEIANLRAINEILRNNGYEVSSRYDGFTTYGSGFIDLLNVHSVYISRARTLAIIALLG